MSKTRFPILEIAYSVGTIGTIIGPSGGYVIFIESSELKDPEKDIEQIAISDVQGGGIRLKIAHRLTQYLNKWVLPGNLIADVALPDMYIADTQGE